MQLGYSLHEQRNGEFLRLRASGKTAAELFIQLLHRLQADYDAETENEGWMGGKLPNAEPSVLIRLESLAVELGIDDDIVALVRRTGSPHEFDELCADILEHG